MDQFVHRRRCVASWLRQYSKVNLPSLIPKTIEKRPLWLGSFFLEKKKKDIFILLVLCRDLVLIHRSPSVWKATDKLHERSGTKREVGDFPIEDLAAK